MSHAQRRIAGFGWQRDTPDHRDRFYVLEEPIAVGHQLAPTGGLKPSELPPIWNQEQEGSCTAHGSLRAYLAEAMKQGLKLPMLSRQFQYGVTRQYEGTFDQDSGAQVRDAIRTLVKVGAIPESELPYESPDQNGQGGNMFTPIPQKLIDEAKQHLAVKYQRITIGGPGAPIRTALSNKLVITFGFPVPESFENGSWDPASEEPLPVPTPNTNYIGGHCVAATSYNYSGKFISTPTTNRKVAPYFTIDNSWGDWGMAGRFNMDAGWFNPSQQLASDLWVIQQVK